MFHQVTIVGRLGQDPALKYLANGTAVCNLNVASDIGHKDATGQWVKTTVWFRVAVWGKQAESANQYLTKGRSVLVVGELRPDPQTGGPRIWTAQDGTPRASFEIHAHNVKFIDGAKGAGQAQDDEDEDDAPF
jgi:single-strand DNA-binding protein